MLYATMYFDWEKYPKRDRNFTFFFQPILPRLRPCYWIQELWCLRDPVSEEAAEALKLMVDDVTFPDTILPRFADQIVSTDRDAFYGFLDPPSPDAFYAGLYAAHQKDEEEWKRFVPRMYDLKRKTLEQKLKEYNNHVRRHGSHVDRFFESVGLEFAFLTADTAWWIATRDPDVIAALHAYAESIPGLSCKDTAMFASL